MADFYRSFGCKDLDIFFRLYPRYRECYDFSVEVVSKCRKLSAEGKSTCFVFDYPNGWGESECRIFQDLVQDAGMRVYTARPELSEAQEAAQVELIARACFDGADRDKTAMFFLNHFIFDVGIVVAWGGHDDVMREAKTYSNKFVKYSKITPWGTCHE